MPPLGVVPATGLTNAGATVVPDTWFHHPENPVLRPLPFPPTLVTTDPGTVPTALRFPERGTVGVLQCVLFRPRSRVFPFSVTVHLRVQPSMALPHPQPSHRQWCALWHYLSRVGVPR